jgi:chemotaxis protein MotB
MMAFFLVMWITGQSQEVKKAIGGYFQDPWGTSSENTAPSFQNPAGLSGEAPMGAIPQGLLPNRFPQSNEPNATEEDAGATSVWQQKHKVHMMDNPDQDLPALVISFEEASATITKTAEERLTRVLPVLAGKPNRIELRAHSSQRPLPQGSPFRDHWQLCYERSSATMAFLQSHGIELARIRLSQSSPHEPITKRLESAWQNENDCVEVFLLTEVVQDETGRAAPDEKGKLLPRGNEPDHSTGHK